MGKRKKPLTIRTQCDWCQLDRSCAGKADHQRKVFFGRARGEEVVCQEHDPRWWRGIVGVAA